MPQSDFNDILSLIFENWTAMRLSVQCNHVTPDLIQDFKGNIGIWFDDTDGKIELDELEQYMVSVSSEDLDMDIEDGSIKQVAKLILDCWRRVKQGEAIEVLQELQGQREKWQGLERGKEKQITLDDILNEDFNGTNEELHKSSIYKTNTLLVSEDSDDNNMEDPMEDTMEDEQGDEWTVVGKK